MPIEDIKYDRKKFSDKMEVVVSNMPKSPTVTALVIFKVGSRQETDQQSGISHFLEHMVFKGNKTYPKTKEIASAIESLGGSFNAFTSKEHTGFYVKVGAEFGDTALRWLSSLVSTPFIKQKDVNSERGVILEEINMYNDTPARQVGDYFEDLLLSGTTLGRNIIGTEKTLGKMSAKDLKNYYNRFYHPSNAVFVMAGNLEKVIGKKNSGNKSFENLKKFFSSLPKNQVEKNNKLEKGRKKSTSRIKVVYKKTDQTHLVLGSETFSLFDERRYPLLLLNTILGGGMSSWAFSEIREKRGLAYYVNSGMHLYQDAGYLAVNAGVNNSKLDLAIQEIIKLFSKMEKGQFSEEEIKKAKDQVIGGMLLQRETSDDIAFLLGSEIASQGEFIPFSKEINLIKRVQKSDLKKIAQEFFKKERLNLALIGPWKKKDEEEFKKTLS